ncbi:MAG TPA: hypothetical protein VGP72_03835 [Planctomycetota bacterium]|jgi:hypothetical protein
MTPTARTLAELRAHGWTAQVVEHWNSFAHIRQDLFGVIDIVAVAPGRGFFGVQATSSTNISTRVAKSKAEPRLKTWLEAGGRFAVVGWGKRGPRGGRKTWQPIWREIVLEQLATSPGIIEKPEHISAPLYRVLDELATVKSDHQEATHEA